MCLRLIGFAFDRYDGTKKKENRRPDQVENALEENPSLIEVNIYRKLCEGVTLVWCDISQDTA